MSQGPPPSQPPSSGGPPPVSGLTTVQALMPKLDQLMGMVFREYGALESGNGFTAKEGSARIYVTADQLNENHTVVTVFSMTNLEIQPTPAFYEWIALNANITTFGHLYVAKRDNGLVDVILTHRLLGTYIDLPELQGALYYISQTADGIDETIKEKFGGRTFHETPDQAEPPGGTPGAGYL